MDNLHSFDIKKTAVALEKVGLSDKLHVRSDSLSGGQQQRVSIARTIVQEADIVLAEELSQPFPVREYFVTGRELLDLTSDIATNLQVDKLYEVVASNQIIPASRLRKAHLMNLFDQYMVNAF